MITILMQSLVKRAPEALADDSAGFDADVLPHLGTYLDAPGLVLPLSKPDMFLPLALWIYKSILKSNKKTQKNYKALSK